MLLFFFYFIKEIRGKDIDNMLVFIKEIRVKDTDCWFKKEEVYYEIRGKVIDRIDLKNKKIMKENRGKDIDRM